MPRVSVIIPTYNQARFIPATISSVLEQTYKDFEIIVIDDGSTDDTQKELERFGSKIKVILQPNSERAVSRNNGVKNSTGAYIAFLDSDDLWSPDKLEKQVEVLDNLKDIVLVYGQSYRINDKGEQIKSAKRQMHGFSGNVFEKLLMRNFIVSATPMIKREDFDKTAGFQTKYIPYEDWEFWLRFSLLGEFYFLPTPMSYYRIHPEQSVKQATAENIERVTNLLLEDSFKLEETSEDIIRKSLGLANLRYCYWYLLANQITIAKEKINKALSLYPQFLKDPRWIGLKTVCQFPVLKNVFGLEQYH